MKLTVGNHAGSSLTPGERKAKNRKAFMEERSAKQEQEQKKKSKETGKTKKRSKQEVTESVESAELTREEISSSSLAGFVRDESSEASTLNVAEVAQEFKEEEEGASVVEDSEVSQLIEDLVNDEESEEVKSKSFLKVKGNEKKRTVKEKSPAIKKPKISEDAIKEDEAITAGSVMSEIKWVCFSILLCILGFLGGFALCGFVYDMLVAGGSAL